MQLQGLMTNFSHATAFKVLMTTHISRPVTRQTAQIRTKAHTYILLLTTVQQDQMLRSKHMNRSISNKIIPTQVVQPLVLFLHTRRVVG